jgi:hypothetical protein
MRLRGDDTRVRFLRIQEEGGRVTPKRGRYLLLPPSNGRGWARVRSVTIRPKHAIRDGMAAVVPSFREAAKARLRDLVAHGE